MKQLIYLLFCFTFLATLTYSCQEVEGPNEELELSLAFSDQSGQPIPITAGNFPSATKASFAEFVNDNSSSIKKRTIRIVRTEAEMAQLWAEMYSHYSHPPQMPGLNFNSDMAIFIFSGSRPSTGYKLHLEEVWEQDDKFVLGIRETIPQNSVLTVITNPFIGISTIKTNKPLHVKFLN